MASADSAAVGCWRHEFGAKIADKCRFGRIHQYTLRSIMFSSAASPTDGGGAQLLLLVPSTLGPLTSGGDHSPKNHCQHDLGLSIDAGLHELRPGSSTLHFDGARSDKENLDKVLARFSARSWDKQPSRRARTIDRRKAL